MTISIEINFNRILYSGLKIARAVRENFIFCDNIDDCLERLRYDEYFAVALSRLHALNNPVISRSELFCFPRENNIYSYLVVMPLKLHYELMVPMDKVIDNLMEFGLVDRWIELEDMPTTRPLIGKTKPH